MIDSLIVSTIAVSYTVLLLRGLATVYSSMLQHGLPEHLAVYVTRKLVHLLAAGVVTLLIPLLRLDPTPLACSALALAAALYAAKRGGALMSWFQRRGDDNEITFLVAWGSSILALWLVTRDHVLATLPAFYISFGDGVTGLARAVVTGRRAKHPIGNAAMALVVLPYATLTAGPAGFTSAAAAVAAERLDNPLDDNVTITLVSTATILAFHAAGLA